MKQVKIGNTNWQTSAVALGVMRMGTIEPKQAADAIDTAYENGIIFIDSADIYGRGKSEKHFAEGLKLSGVNRDQLYIQSKGGIVPDKRYDFSKKHLIESVDGILSRMKIDYLDSFLLHRPDPLMEPEEVKAAFDELQTAGKVRHFGVSNFNPQQFAFLQENLDQKLLINQLQFSLEHTNMIDFGMHTNMTDTGSIDHDGGLIEYSRRQQTTIQTWSPFQYGTFEGTFIDNDKFPELNQKLAELADKYHVSKNGIAVAWILRHPANMQVLIGTMNPKHIADSAQGADVSLTKQEWYDLYLAAGNTLP